MHHVPTKQAVDQFTNSPKAGQENIEYCDNVSATDYTFVVYS